MQHAIIKLALKRWKAKLYYHLKNKHLAFYPKNLTTKIALLRRS